MHSTGALLAFFMVMGSGCGRQEPSPEPADALPQPPPIAAVTRASFGTLPDGTGVELYTLKNAGGMEVRITNYGGIVTSLKVPDRNGRFADVVLGHDTLEGYLHNAPYFGAIVGRYANRIGKARFQLDGKTYRLAANDGPNTLHGGLKGFDKAVWRTDTFEQPGASGVVLTHASADGDGGFPGTLAVRVTYTLNDKNELAIDYRATTDKPTVLNLTHHGYFNLAGHDAGDILKHELTIDADRYTPVDATLIPTGVLANVAGTPFDFRSKTAIGARIDADDAQLKLGKGYDHNFVLNREGAGLVLAARVEEPQSGRVMEVRTTEPGVQLYTGNFLDGTVTGKSGHAYRLRHGLCLETQHFPDSPNQPDFPTTTLRPGGEFTSTTVYSFSVR
jgi:aldose 1-epimerase